MDLTLTYSEAIDFIINLDLANLSHDNHKAFIYEARKILCSYLAEGKPDSEKVITFSPEENYKFEPVERDCSFWIEKPGLPFLRPAEELIEKEKYSSDGIRAFMENKSLKERNRPFCSGWSVATAKEAKQIAREEIKRDVLQYLPVFKELKTLKKENERLKAELEQKGKLPAVAKPARQFVLNQIRGGYPEGEFKGWKREAIAEEVIARAKRAGYDEKDIPVVSTILRDYFKK